MSVTIEKVYEGYYVGRADPPHALIEYRSPEILPRDMLSEELRKRGVAQTDIDAAFGEAERYWVSS